MIEAVVQTGTFETSYRRAGTGGVVLLIGEADSREADWLFGELAGRFRAIAPMLPPELSGANREPASPDLERLELWLRGLIDGLGVERAAVVAAASYGPGLLRFAAIDPDRVRRLALVSHGGGIGEATGGRARGASDGAAGGRARGASDGAPDGAGPGWDPALEDAARAALLPVLLARIPGAGEGAGEPEDRRVALERLLGFLSESP